MERAQKITFSTTVAKYGLLFAMELFFGTDGFSDVLKRRGYITSHELCDVYQGTTLVDLRRFLITAVLPHITGPTIIFASTFMYASDQDLGDALLAHIRKLEPTVKDILAILSLQDEEQPEGTEVAPSLTESKLASLRAMCVSLLEGTTSEFREWLAFTERVTDDDLLEIGIRKMVEKANYPDEIMPALRTINRTRTDTSGDDLRDDESRLLETLFMFELTFKRARELYEETRDMFDTPSGAGVQSILLKKLRGIMAEPT